MAREYPKQREPKKTVEKDSDLLDRIKKIRLSTGLNQGDFYREYLADIANRSITSQGAQTTFVSDLEKGKAILTPALLSRYADIGHTSIDFIVTGKEHTDPESGNDNFTYSDFLRMLNYLTVLDDVVLVRHEYETEEEGREYNAEYDTDMPTMVTVKHTAPALLLLNPELQRIAKEYQNTVDYVNSIKSGTNIFGMWYESELKDSNKPIHDFSKIPNPEENTAGKDTPAGND